MIEVFKTTVKDAGTQRRIVTDLLKMFRNAMVNFDPEDCDHILRVETIVDFQPEAVMAILEKYGHRAWILD